MSKYKNKKKPTHNINIQTKKQPQIDNSISPDNINEKRLVWKLCHIDFDGPWNWFNLNNRKKIQEVIKKMKNFETMLWGELKRARRNSPCHPIPRENLCSKAKQRLIDLKLDDIDDLYELVMNGKNRIWGIKQAEIICLLWWDPDHSVYPVKKRNT